MLLLAKNKRQ